uniref:DDE Tnp4 domain-containing protein n=1 Tax=Stomoxys calcitrans TaxID=35570 RepID=A0A1I8NSR3_STOCA
MHLLNKMELNISATLLAANKIIAELLDSSSSSEDEEEFAAVLPVLPEQPRNKKFAETVLDTYTEKDFLDNFYISRHSFMYLVRLYSQYCTKGHYQSGGQQAKLEKQMLLYLWFSVNATSFRETAALFEVSLSAIHQTFCRILKFLNAEMLLNTIRLPETNEEKESTANDFENIAGFPNVLGCVARCFLCVKPSSSVHKSDGGQTILLLQAICDAHNRFLDISCEDFNHISPASDMLNPLAIGKNLPELCSPHYHLLAENDIWPLNEFVLTPYSDDGTLSDSENTYNSKFRKTCDNSLRTFILLKSRFRQLTKMSDFANVPMMCQFIKSCCVIHNICHNRGDFLNKEMQFDQVDTNMYKYPQANIGENNMLKQLGQIKRNEIKEHLKNLTRN